MKVMLRHTPKKYSNPISEGKIIPTDTTIEFIIGGVPGKFTCKAHCEYCFLPFRYNNSYSIYSPENIDNKIEIEKKQISDLVSCGYKVAPRISDTFSWKGKYLESGILDGNSLYDQDEMDGLGVAWTSGLPLLDENCTTYLDLAKKHNLCVIALTSHGINDGDIPVKGIVQPSIVRQVIERIKEYNCQNDDCFLISLTFTLSANNLHLLEEYISYAAFLGADYVRFNRLIDFSENGKFQDIMLTPDDNRKFFEQINTIRNKSQEEIVNEHIHKFSHLNIQKNQIKNDIKINISTDFGFEGEEILNETEPINRCPGGVNMFAVFDGLVYPCAELFKTPIGKLTQNKTKHFEIHLNPDLLKSIKSSLIDRYSYKGCIAYTLVYNKLDLYNLA